MSSDAMIAALLPEGRAPAGARCADHPDRAAVAICSRCGSFVCKPETIVYDRKGFCPKCCELPDVEWLEIYRRSLESKRSMASVAAWVCAVAALGAAGFAFAFNLGAVPIASAAAGTFVAAAGVERKWRPAMYLAPLSWLAVGAACFVWLTGAVLALGVPMLAMMVYAIAVNGARGRISFRLPVTRGQLLQDYRINGDNPAAQAAVGLGVFGVVVPFVFVPVLWLARVARRAVNENANPPVGRKSDAELATGLGVVGAITTLGWVWFSHGFGLWR